MRVAQKLSIVLLFSLSTLTAAANSELSGVISGVVRDQQTGKPIAGATVFLEGLGHGCPTANHLARQDGSFRFSDLPAGNYRISVFKQGFKRVNYGETKQNPIGEEIVLIPSRMRARLTVLLPAGAGISGHIYDIKGQPIAGCSVTFDPVGVTGSIYFTRTDACGYYWVSDLPPGLYKINARRFSEEGKVTGNSWYHPGTFREEQAEHVDLKGGETAALDLYFGEERNPVWTGKIFGMKGEPVAGAEIRRIRFLEKTTSVDSGCWTDKTGTCSLAHLEDGEYWFFIQSAPEPYAVWFDSKLDTADAPDGYAKRVQIGDGEPVITEFRLSRKQSIKGQFYRADGSRVSDPGITVHLSHNRRVPGTFVTLPAHAKATTGDSFKVFGIHPELDYNIELSSSERRFCPVRIILNDTDITDAEAVRFPAGMTSKMQIYVTPAATIAGTGPQHQVWTAEWIAGPRFPKSMYHAFTALGGREKFLFRGLPPGSYRVHPQNEKEPYAEVTVEAGETKEIVIQGQ